MTFNYLYIKKQGSYAETYNQRKMFDKDLKLVFVQGNQSLSIKGVLQSLHVQKTFTSKTSVGYRRHGI